MQLAALERTWQRVQADRLLEAGVTLIDPDRIDIRGELVCGQDVEIDVGCVFEGRVVLGNGMSLIIFVSIVSRVPSAIFSSMNLTADTTMASRLRWSPCLWCLPAFPRSSSWSVRSAASR